MGMAVDWIGQNLYWTDEGLRGIFVADLKEASKRLLLISKDLVHPRSIVVDSANGVMYWANWPAGPPLENELKESTGGKIEVSWLDGSNRRPLVQDDLIWPNGLSIDTHSNRYKNLAVKKIGSSSRPERLKKSRPKKTRLFSIF